MYKILLTAFLFTSFLSAQEQPKTSVLEQKKQPAVTAVNAEKTAVKDSKDPLEELKKTDQALKTLKASFKQEIHFKDADIKQKVEGRISYLKPNFLKIEHISPKKQIIITDKKEIKIYREGETEPYIMNWDSWKSSQGNSLSAILEIGNYSSLTEKNSYTTKEEKDFAIIEFKNKKNPSAYQLTLWLSKEDFFPKKALLKVEDATVTTELYDIKKDIPIKNEEFEIKEKKEKSKNK